MRLTTILAITMLLGACAPKYYPDDPASWTGARNRDGTPVAGPLCSDDPMVNPTSFRHCANGGFALR